MRVLNETPYLAGTKVTAQRPPKPQMVVVVRAAFVLSPASSALALPPGPYPASQGALSGERFREEDEDRALDPVYPGDFADWKPSADLMCLGACHPPAAYDGAPGPQRGPLPHAPRLAAGPGAAPGAALRRPFKDTLVRFSVGRWSKTVDAVPPPRMAPFGPVSSESPERRARMGKRYDQSYRAARSPFYAEDIAPDAFSAAPVDQRMPFLRGDETVGFLHLHPDVASWSVPLPGERIRAFSRDDRGATSEVAMVLDTVFADLPAERLYLTWRGLCDVREIDLSCVRSLLVVTERLADPLGDPGAYHAKLDRFERDPTGADSRVPEPFRDLWRSFSGPDPAPPPAARAPVDPVTALLRDKLRGLAAPEMKQIEARMAALVRSPAPPGTSWTALLTAALAALPKPAPAGVPMAPTATFRPPGADKIRALLSRAPSAPGSPGHAESEKALSDAKARLSPVIGQDSSVTATDPVAGVRWGSGAASQPSAPYPGADFSGQDLRGRDFSGVDLTNARFDDAILAGARLERACLKGASFERAVLSDASFNDADLTGARFTKANLLRATFVRAVLSAAILNDVHAVEASFEEADLRKVLGERSWLAKATFARADLRAAAFTGAVFDGAVLASARCAKAELHGCRFLEADLKGADFEGARLSRTSFAAADASSARFVDATGPHLTFKGAVLERADLRGAAFPGAVFDEVRAASAKMAVAAFENARFYRADLEGVDFTASNLRSAELFHARVKGARFRQAVLYDAKLFYTDTSAADLTGATLTHAVVEGP